MMLCVYFSWNTSPLLPYGNVRTERVKNVYQTFDRELNNVLKLSRQNHKNDDFG